MTQSTEKKHIKLKPDFIICGVQKCGTTSLLKYLSQHKQIEFQPGGTEIHFFDNSENYKKGQTEFNKHFKNRNSNVLIGQSTSTYIYDYIPERMFKYAPDTKLVFILRNPINRAYSHFWHANSKNRENLNFEEALKKEDSRIKKDYWHLINYSYFNSGIYMNMVESFSEYYNKKQMHFVILEELKANPVNEINKILDFLKLDRIINLKTEKAYNQTKVSKFSLFGKLFNNRFTRNSKLLYPLYIFNNKYFSNKYPIMKQETRNALLEKYIKDIEELEIFLNKKLDFWKS